MVFEFISHRMAAKAPVAMIFMLFCALLVFLAVSNFIVGGLTDERVSTDRHALTSAASIFPNSARLHFRLASVMESERDLSGAERHALKAINSSPYNYNYYLLLAEIKESRNDPAAAEQFLRAALSLAPNRTEVHWRLANLLLRQGRFDHALEGFQRACSLDNRLLPVTLNLVWRASGGSLEELESVTGSKTQDRLALAQFLLKQSRVAEAADVFDRLDKSARIASSEGAAFLKSLIAANYLKKARDLWAGSISENAGPQPLIWNGSFESDIVKGFPQFDWAINGSDYARIRIDAGTARTGARSLRVDFTGRDTTRLDGEIRQLIVVRPGARYRMECYAKAENLVTTGGPRLVVTSNTSSATIAESEPVDPDQVGWQQLAVVFTAPRSAATDGLALYLTIKRKPKFSFDEPMRGRIWFDDFTLEEMGK